jgi:hypothetical protein
MLIKQHKFGRFDGFILYLSSAGCREANRKSGSIILLSLALAVVFAVLFLFVFSLVLLLMERERYQQALESAALQAAADLSKIVINDPYFGFISLSDQNAIGRATVAQDGEPLPVHGINTIIATSRLDYIIACEAGDEKLQQLALQDAQHARESAARLNNVLEKALEQRLNDQSSAARDMDGAEVHPFADALSVYEKSLHDFTRADSEKLQLSLGWLRNGGGTITPAPMSNQTPSRNDKNSYLSPGTTSNSCYRAYVDIPVGNEHFSFASLGIQPGLVSDGQFVPKRDKPSLGSYEILENDVDWQLSLSSNGSFIPEKQNKYLSSIVKAKAVWHPSGLFNWGNNKLVTTEIVQACAQPYAVAPQPAPTVLEVNFLDGLPGNIHSLGDLLADSGMNQSVMDAYAPINGDFGIDAASQLQSQRTHPSAAWAFAVCFHDWLRSNYILPKIDSVLASLNQNLANTSQSSHSIFALETAADGNVVLSGLLGNPFGTIIVQENQLYLSSDTPVSIGGHSWNVICRDQVHTMGTIAGGKHAGQPLPGDPVNWDVLPTYIDQRLAQAATSRRLGGIVVSGQEELNGGIALTGAQLKSANGQYLDRNLRTATYAAGLAAEVLISYPRRPLR